MEPVPQVEQPAALDPPRQGHREPHGDGREDDVEGNHDVPAESERAEFLRPSDTTSVCGWKSTASYRSLEVDGQVNTDATFTYPEPKEATSQIAGRFAVRKGVEVTA